MLFDGEGERGFDQRLRFGAAAELEQQFSEENAGHHPVGFFRDAEFEMRDRLGRAVGCDQRLRETEPEHLVGWVTLD